MAKGWSIALGIGLIILWIAGVSQPGTTGWLTWLDGIVGALAIIWGSATPSTAAKSTRVGGPIAVCIGLFALWIIGLATAATPWLSWWTFAFACAYLLTGAAAGAEKAPTEMPHQMRRAG